MEAYTFNAMGCPSPDTAVSDLFVSYCKRLRDEAGKKFQVVVFRNLADYEGVVSLKNGIAEESEIPAVAGAAVAVSYTHLDVYKRQVKHKLEQYPEREVIALLDDARANHWKGIPWDRLDRKKGQEKESRWREL